MTKMKSKKMAKSTFAIIIMGIVMVAMLAFGGTFAYFTATADKASTEGIKTATVQLGAITGLTTTATKVQSGDVIVGSDIEIANSSNIATWVFVAYQVTINSATVSAYESYDAYNTAKGTTEEFDGVVATMGDGWTLLNADTVSTAKYAIYGKSETVAASTVVTLPLSVKYYASSNSTATAVGSKMDQDVKVDILARSIQENSETSSSAFTTVTEAFTALNWIPSFGA